MNTVRCIWVTAVAVIISFVSGFAADKQADGMALIQKALDQTDLRKSGPYTIHAKLTVNDEATGKREGTDVVSFDSTARWRRELRMTGYNEVAVFLGQFMYRTRSLQFTPPSLRGDIAGGLRNLPETLSYKVMKISSRKVGDAKADCVSLQQPRKDTPFEVTWCFDSTTGLPLARYGHAYGDRTEFTNYKPFGQKQYASTVQEFTNGKPSGTATIESVESGVGNDVHLFDTPAGAIPRPWCDDMQGPRPVSFPWPDIPLGARGHSGLELHYELTLDAQGNVTAVVPMAPKALPDRIAIGALRDWSFYPAMCGSTPVPTDVEINVAARWQ
ncbi:MAG TPA: hypothetical protein VFP40_17530 [Terriglobales bacterium]|nr:hypothetical protein [Terriglobales bacterium]